MQWSKQMDALTIFRKAEKSSARISATTTTSFEAFCTDKKRYIVVKMSICTDIILETEVWVIFALLKGDHTNVYEVRFLRNTE